jgi:hypothetical protein
MIFDKVPEEEALHHEAEVYNVFSLAVSLLLLATLIKSSF